MATTTPSPRASSSFAKFGRNRIYGLPRDLSEHKLKDNGIFVDELGSSRKR